MRYYLDNPGTADSLEGIAAWRLLEEIVEQRVHETELALRWLVAHGYLERMTGPATPPVFRLRPAQREEGEQFVAAIGLQRRARRRGGQRWPAATREAVCGNRRSRKERNVTDEMGTQPNQTGNTVDGAVEADRYGHVYNARGVIAENYYDLQGLGVLMHAREAHPLDKASPQSTLRAVYQAVEIGLLNLANVVGRAASDVEEDRQGPSLVKMYWARGFHRVLVRLSMLPHQLGLPLPDGDRGVPIRICDSLAFRDYLDALSRFDHQLQLRLASGELPLEQLIGDCSTDDARLALIHVARICNHESTIWEHNLSELRVPSPATSYAEFVVSDHMRDAVYDRVLSGDTYFTQFRGLHQIPETLGDEVNEHAEQAIRDIRAGSMRSAFEHLRCANILTDGILASLAPMADNLATSDYHQIRENLGLTSGSHSVCLRFQMFSDLYKQLWEAIAQQLPRAPGHHEPVADVEEAIREVDRTRLDAPDAWLLHLLLEQCLSLRTFIFQWRDQHLHMPRNNLGGGSTKSLTGSPDAILAVKKMRAAAEAVDCMQPLALARGLPLGRLDETHPLRRYLDSDSSLDSRLLIATGEVTQRRFQQVQHRLGFFAEKCPFVPPAPRRV